MIWPAFDRGRPAEGWAWTRRPWPGWAALGAVAEGMGWALLGFAATWAIGAGLVVGLAVAPLATAAVILGLVAWALAYGF